MLFGNSLWVLVIVLGVMVIGTALFFAGLRKARSVAPAAVESDAPELFGSARPVDPARP